MGGEGGCISGKVRLVGRLKDVRCGGGEAEAAISEAEWFPLVSDALATARGVRVAPACVPRARRGGRMAPVPKKAMVPFTLQNNRGVFCANVAGKVVAKVVRSQLVGASGSGGRRTPAWSCAAGRR